MQRVRRAANTALVLVVALCLASGPAAPSQLSAVARAATVGWPPSTLVVSEAQTGGASASDEFVEIANQGTGPVDLIGLELVYATSTGTTVTRKATWAASAILGPGKRLLVTNSAGSFSGLGDAVYSGGFAATGGALALRIVGGSVVDAIGWGDATNAFVEGTAAPAPPAGSSLERRPGGLAGNGTDTNDNAADWFVASIPSPQNLSAPPVPEPGPVATPTPTPIATSTPTPMATPEPTPTPSATASPPVSPSPDPTSTPTPTPAETPSPTPVATATPTPSPTPTPTPTPASPLSIETARALPDGTDVLVAGILTTPLGALESGRTSFIQDSTGGIAVYLDAAVIDPLPAGMALVVRGTVDARFAQRTVRAAEADLTVTGDASAPAAADTATGAAGETAEGLRIRVTGAIVDGPDALADGSAVTVDDGSGPVRVVVTPDALGGRSLDVGSTVTASGPLGQRDSSGTGLEGYRLFVTGLLDLVIEPSAAPSPTPSPTSTPAPTTSPSPTATPTLSPSTTGPPTPSLSPTPSVSPAPIALTIAAIRSLPVGTTVTVRGVVTAEAGRLGTPSLLAIADATGGIVIKRPDGVATAARGRTLVVTGPIADPYGQLEVRPAMTGFSIGGNAALPDAIELPAAGPSEATEGRLVRLTGTVTTGPSKATSGDITLSVETTAGTLVRVMADASSRLGPTSFTKGARYRITGIVGQRASRKGALDGYRVWVRDAHDVVLLAAAPGATPSATARPGASGNAPSVVGIASALRTRDRDLAIEAVVTAPADLLDSSGRRVVVQDASGAIEVLLPKDAQAPKVGARIRAIGRVGTAYGASRLRATSVERRGTASIPAPLRVAGPLTSAHTWRLVAVAGRVEDVRKLGERWRAEIAVGSQRLVVVGQPGAHIPSTALHEGGTAEIVGIVRPAYPSASDKRASVLPRSRGDIRSGPAPGASVAGTTATGGALVPPTGSAAPDAAGPALVADLVDLATLVGRTVRVGGLVIDLRPDGFTLDDGTATGHVVLAGPAADSIDLVEPGDAINVTGRVEVQPDGSTAVVVDDRGAISLGSTLADATANGPASDGSSAPSEPADIRIAGFGDSVVGLPGAGAGALGLLAIAILSVVAAIARRRQGRRLLAVRVATRLAALAAVRATHEPAALATTTRRPTADHGVEGL
jgi:hypothetical protein